MDSQNNQPYQQPNVPNGKVMVSQRDREGTFKVAGSILMLIFAIVTTATYISSFFAFSVIYIVDYVVNFFLVLGAWLLWGMARGKKDNAIGAKFIKFNVVFNFIVETIVYALVIILAIIVVASASCVAGATDSNIAIFPFIILAFVIIAFVFNILYFKSIKGCINNVISVMGGGTARDEKSGTFAAVIMIIKAVIKFAPSIFFAFGSAIIAELLGSVEGLTFLTDILAGVGIAAFVSGLIGFLNGILVAVIILNYNKNLD